VYVCKSMHIATAHDQADVLDAIEAIRKKATPGGNACLCMYVFMYGVCMMYVCMYVCM
jgi:hypothetical protein